MTEKLRVVIQARYTSGRLPGKALLPVGRVPMVVLAAKRVMRDGLDVVVATSDHGSDDPIVWACESAGIRVFRGPLENVYERFIGATADIDDDATVVRLTADNVFPDADFVRLVVDCLNAGGSDYVAPRWPQDGLPYGVMAEAFQAGSLRRAPPECREDAEHVTPALRRAVGNSGIPKQYDLADLRATVDTFEDYSLVTQVFERISDAIAIDWGTLCAVLKDRAIARIPCSVRLGRFQSQMTLGSAQFGMKYGIANVHGIPSIADVEQIVHAAIDRGVTHIDTARLYGESESRIGRALLGPWRQRVSVITKIGPVSLAEPADARAAVMQSVSQSLRSLGIEQIETMLLHRAVNRTTAGGAVWDALRECKRSGLISRLGVSVQNRAEFVLAAADSEVELIQLPLNLLDRRWDDLPPVRSNLTIHARSIFLQGLLSGSSLTKWPVSERFDSGRLVSELEQLSRDLGRRNVVDLAVAFVRARSWVDSLVIGVETQDQLKDNIAHFTAAPLTPDEVELVKRRLPHAPDQLVDPSQWRFA